jgi:hypothetical protein
MIVSGECCRMSLVQRIKAKWDRLVGNDITIPQDSPVYLRNTVIMHALGRHGANLPARVQIAPTNIRDFLGVAPEIPSEPWNQADAVLWGRLSSDLRSRRGWINDITIGGSVQTIIGRVTICSEELIEIEFSEGGPSGSAHRNQATLGRIK